MTVTRAAEGRCIRLGTRDFRKEELPETGAKAGFWKTDLARTKGFSKPTVMTRKGSASERMTGLMLTPSRYAVNNARRSANVPETRVEQPVEISGVSADAPQKHKYRFVKAYLARICYLIYAC